MGETKIERLESAVRKFIAIRDADDGHITLHSGIALAAFQKIREALIEPDLPRTPAPAVGMSDGDSRILEKP